MNDVNAAIGMENFKHIDEIIEKHKDNASYYDKNLKGVKGVTLLERNPDMDSAFWIYSLKVERKGDFMKYMKECGIAVSQVHERNDIHTCVKEYRSLLPNLDRVIGEVISIPIGWWVTEEDRKYIVDCIKKGW
jgi:dTDP-4-amino-4,6-dideoxygalactose transaminase